MSSPENVTVVQRPLKVQIADAIRIQIDSGELRPGDRIPSQGELAHAWGCSPGTAQGAHELLHRQGLISPSRGHAPVVREPPAQTEHRSETAHQAGKDAALSGKHAAITEVAMGIPQEDTDLRVKIEIISAGDLADVLGIPADEQVLQRRWRWSQRDSGVLLRASASHIPYSIASGSKDLLDPSAEVQQPPGGTLRQLAALGIEVHHVTEHVRAREMTTVEQHEWGALEGVPMLVVQRALFDTNSRVVDVAVITLPADRTTLRYTISLDPWPADWPSVMTQPTSRGYQRRTPLSEGQGK